MNKKICKIIIAVIIILVFIVGIMYFIDLDKMKKGEQVVFSTWGSKYAPIVNETENQNTYENNRKYSKEVDNTKIELNIPNEWNYEEVPIREESPSYRYALKLYKNDKNKYATLYFYDNPFGVCGTDRTEEKITLNNGEQATMGYYGTSKDWCDISFHNINEHIVILNDGNLGGDDAKEIIEFIKTINITNKQTEFSLVFYQKTAIKPKQTEKIISKGEIKGIDYNIYSFEGNIAINLNSDNSELMENSISLREALLQNKITIEEIIEKANKDFPDTISYDDGGSMEYHYPTYTIVKLNKLDGNKDVYIGDKNMTIHDLEI